MAERHIYLQTRWRDATWWLSFKYESREAYESNCTGKTDKYMYLSQIQGDAAALSMQSAGGTVGDYPYYWFSFDDKPYDDCTLGHSGGYLYVKNCGGDPERLAVDFGTDDQGETLKLGGRPDGSMIWYKVGQSYQKGPECVTFYYLQTTSDAAQGCVFQIKDVRL